MPTLTGRVLDLEEKVATQVERSENAARQRDRMEQSVQSLRQELISFTAESTKARIKNEAKLDKLLSNGHSKQYGIAATGIGGGTGAAAIILIIEKFLGG